MYLKYYTEIRECASNPCASGSTCEENMNAGYTCRCKAGYQGKHCDIGMIYKTTQLKSTVFIITIQKLPVPIQRCQEFYFLIL